MTENQNPPVETDDTEGHIAKAGRLVDDEVEGHVMRDRGFDAGPAEPDDTEGHMPFKRSVRAGRLVDEGDDVEGHVARCKADAERADDTDDDTEGHASKYKF